VAIIRYPHDPQKLEGEPPFIADMRILAETRKLLGMRAIGKMLKDLLVNGTESRYLNGITGYPILELKTRSRGGEAGGARVYLYRADDQEFHLCAAEVKIGISTNPELLKRTAFIAWHWLEGYEIFPTTQAQKRTKRN
jgi:hypothetical protein